MLAADYPVPLTCPTCGAVLTWHQPSTSFQCPLGHTFLLEQLAAASDKALTRTLWACLRQLAERHWLLTQLAARTDSPATQLATLQAAMQHLREWLPPRPTREKA